MRMVRNDLIYHFSRESVTLEYHDQYLSFNSYELQSKRRYNNFANELKSSESDQYGNLNSIIHLAKKHGIRPMKGCKPTIVNNIAF